LRRWLLRLALPVAVVAVALFPAAGTAWANKTININSGNVPTTAKAFGGHDCDFGGGPFADKDVWIFVLPGNAGDFVSITADFGANGTVTITRAANPGNFDTPGTPKAFLVEPAGFTLVGASAVVTDAATKTFFNLTGTCAATGTKTPTPTPTPPTTTTTAPGGGGGSSSSSTTHGGGGGSSSTAGSNGGTLPVTGVAVTGFVIAGLVLIGGGAALLYARRRMDRAQTPNP
jgi:LPXTG-motif cell wall-anchored protein